MIKHLLVTWFRNEPSPVDPEQTIRLEKINRVGDVVDIDDESSYQRLEDLGSFFTDEEREKIEEGTYTGPGAAQVYAALGNTSANPTPLIEDAEGEGRQVDNLSSEELADYIKSNRLTVEETVALAGDDADSINKVLDAENIATDNDPRKGVETALEAKLAAATS
jgi:hypothetical protein